LSALTLAAALLYGSCVASPGADAPLPPENKPEQQPEASGEEQTVAITAEGRIEAAGVTTWMYGSHVLISAAGEIRYALKSTDLELSRWEGERVRLQGVPVSGYPVDGGPPYLRVIAVEIPER
jgi:hypothetical protein